MASLARAMDVPVLEGVYATIIPLGMAKQRNGKKNSSFTLEEENRKTL